MLEQVFISYTHQHKDEVSEVAEYLRKSGLTVFLDKNLEPGRDWRKQLEERINACQVFLVFITKDILEKRDGPRADSFVFEEIHIAKEADVARIYPVIVGNISVEVDFPQIAGFHGTRVTSVLETVASKEFHQHVADLKEYIEAGGPRAAHDHMRALRADSVMWPTSGENLIEKQALALAVMLLEGEQLFLISDAAQIFQAQIETQLRDLTEGELEKQPRIFGGPDQSELLEEIGAHRMVPEVGLSAGIQLVEFKRPGHAAALIEYLWTEQPKVREHDLAMSWAEKCPAAKSGKVEIRASAMGGV